MNWFIYCSKCSLAFNTSPVAGGHRLPGASFLLFEVEGLGLHPKTDWTMQRMDLMPSPHPECQPWKPTFSCSPPVDVSKSRDRSPSWQNFCNTHPIEQFVGSREDRQPEASSSVPYCTFSFRVVSLIGVYEGFLRKCFEHWKLQSSWQIHSVDLFYSTEVWLTGIFTVTGN